MFEEKAAINRCSPTFIRLSTTIRMKRDGGAPQLDVIQGEHW